MQQILLKKIAQRLTPNQKKFIAEVLGTFIVVVFATGSVVIDAKLKGALGIPFIAFAPFVGVAIGVLYDYKAYYKDSVSLLFSV